MTGGAFEGFGDPRISLSVVGDGKVHGFAALEESADLLQRFEG